MSSLGGDDSNGHPKDEPEKGPGTGPSDDPGDENDPGYKIFSGTPPTQDKIEAAMAEISTESLRMFRQSESDLGFQMLGWGKNFDDLLHDGLDLPGNEYLLKLLGRPYEPEPGLKQVVVFMQNRNQLEIVRASRNRVFIYRALGETLGPHNGFFRIVEGSHRMSLEEIKNANAKTIHLQPGQAIIFDGRLAIYYPQEGGGVGLYRAIPRVIREA